MSLVAGNQHRLNRIPNRCVDSLMSLAASNQHYLNMIPNRCVDSICLWQQVTNIT
jgi:hypothetical protein